MEETPWGFKSPLSHMKKLIATLLILSFAPLCAAKIDPNHRKFDTSRKTQQVERYDFDGTYPQLEDVYIDAHKKKNVELKMEGEYPVLRNVTYDGSFGRVRADLTGSFPVLTDVDFKVTSSRVDLDLRGQWGSDCNIIVTGTSANVTIKLPDDVALDIKTKTTARGKAKCDKLKKKGLFTKKRFQGGPEDADVTLTIYVEVTDGQITLR